MHKNYSMHLLLLEYCRMSFRLDLTGFCTASRSPNTRVLSLFRLRAETADDLPTMMWRAEVTGSLVPMVAKQMQSVEPETDGETILILNGSTEKTQSTSMHHLGSCFVPETVLLHLVTPRNQMWGAWRKEPHEEPIWPFVIADRWRPHLDRNHGSHGGTTVVLTCRDDPDAKPAGLQCLLRTVGIHAVVHLHPPDETVDDLTEHAITSHADHAVKREEHHGWYSTPDLNWSELVPVDQNSPIKLLQPCLCPQVISRMIGMFRHYDNTNRAHMRSMTCNGRMWRTGALTYQWRGWRRPPEQRGAPPSARRCVCPDASRHMGWCRPAGVWVGKLLKWETGS